MVAQLEIRNEKYTLNNGTVIPAIGLGTWQLDNRHEFYDSVKCALKNGYRHIDTAACYKNEEYIGKAIKDSGIPREEIFITTKIWNDRHKDVAKALDESLEKLGVEYVDLYLVHWPVSIDPKTGKPYDDWDYVDTYKALQKLYKESGKIKALGVSNFTKKKLERLLNDPEVDVVPVVNQIEAHPLLTQDELYKYLEEKNIKIAAYSPLGSAHSPLIKNETILEIANKNGVDAGQVLISWAVQRKTIVLPKSVKESRLISNLKTFILSDKDFETLNKLSEKYGVVRTCTMEYNNFDD